MKTKWWESWTNPSRGVYFFFNGNQLWFPKIFYQGIWYKPSGSVNTSSNECLMHSPKSLLLLNSVAIFKSPHRAVRFPGNTKSHLVYFRPKRKMFCSIMKCSQGQNCFGIAKSLRNGKCQLGSASIMSWQPNFPSLPFCFITQEKPNHHFLVSAFAISSSLAITMEINSKKQPMNSKQHPISLLYHCV